MTEDGALQEIDCTLGSAHYRERLSITGSKGTWEIDLSNKTAGNATTALRVSIQPLETPNTFFFRFLESVAWSPDSCLHTVQWISCFCDHVKLKRLPEEQQPIGIFNTYKGLFWCSCQTRSSHHFKIECSPSIHELHHVSLADPKMRKISAKEQPGKLITVTADCTLSWKWGSLASPRESKRASSWSPHNC